MKIIIPSQIYTLPSGTIIRVCSELKEQADEWNCIYESKHTGTYVTFTGAFLRNYGELW